ncbi:sirohydrochlorin ferrochelatase B [Wolffia australiana]
MMASTTASSPVSVGRGPQHRKHLRASSVIASPKSVKLRGSSSNFMSLSGAPSLSLRNEGYGGVKCLVGPADGVIVVDHGSRRQESNLMLNEFVKMFINRTGYQIVEPAHMELAEPSIADAFKSCVDRGATRIIVSPLFLFPGRHWNQDIPSLAAEAAKEYPGISYIVTAPLGLHELLVDVMSERINHCLLQAAGEAPECDVCAGTNKCRLRRDEN